MINNQSKLSVKDNLSVRKILCISTIKKNKIKAYAQFKAVITESSNKDLQKGHLINAFLVNSTKNNFGFSGKIKKFDINEAVIIKESKKRFKMVGSRVVGMRTFNLKYFFEKKPFSFSSCK